MKIEINTDNAWAIINYHLSAEIDFAEDQFKIKIPDNIDEALVFMQQRNLVETALYNLLVLKKELLTGEGEANASPQP